MSRVRIPCPAPNIDSLRAASRTPVESSRGATRPRHVVALADDHTPIALIMTIDLVVVADALLGGKRERVAWHRPRRIERYEADNRREWSADDWTQLCSG